MGVLFPQSEISAFLGTDTRASGGVFAETCAVISKSISDGVVNAKIAIGADKQPFMRSVWSKDVYASSVPLEEFHKRTAFCMQLHSDAMRCIEYKPAVAADFVKRDLEDVDMMDSDMEGDDF